MAAKKQWLLRVPEIRQEVAALDVSVVDRALFERLFDVGWRRAIDLMHSFGAYQAGQSLLMDRSELLRQLEAWEAGTEFAIEHSRRERLRDSIEELRKFRAAAAVRIPVESPLSERSIATLPAGVSLDRDSLRVEFQGVQDLLAKLFELSRALADDFEAFKDLIERAAA